MDDKPFTKDTADPLQLTGSGTTELKDVVINASVFKLDNGFLVMVSDRPGYGLGTLSMSIPPNEISDKSIGAPMAMFGLKHTTLTNIIGKRASKQLGKPVLTIIYLQDQTLALKQLQKLAMEAVSHALEKTQAFLKQ